MAYAVVSVIILASTHHHSPSSAPSPANLPEPRQRQVNHALQENPPLHIFSPLGNDKHLESIGVSKGHAHPSRTGRTMRKDRGFDLAMIPIGVYKLRWFMSTIHCVPQDSVRIFKDIRAKRAVAMHWGTCVLKTEEIMEPPKRLVEECKKIDINDRNFLMSDIGETKYF
ncbi:uncharacterized protein ARMOST_20113 [Armillaria ostoyae]|uniref:Metallo-beta-lactamase domain-containing protein n=1 Tax=Armillaria ostoyae TaxID=47428 RepID=A0A284S6E5_ARMOS|nr:uncharacterized protein ARMOST_20113 [Armillaria ostoyae]